MANVLLTIGILVTLGGAANLWWVLRSCREGSHPICKTCGYDLRAIWKRIVQCPECGGDVRVVRCGVWRPDWKLAIGPMLLIALGLTLGGVGLIPRLSRLSPAQAAMTKPVPILLIEAHDYDRAKAGAAISELLIRRYTGQLSDSEDGQLSQSIRNRPRIDQLVRLMPLKVKRLSDLDAAMAMWSELESMGVSAPQPVLEDEASQVVGPSRSSEQPPATE